MAYAIEGDETLHASIQRIMDELIVRARDILVDPETPAEKRVHEARKRFKETRALIRLVRKPLGEQFAHENAWYRDAGRELAAARDADAMIAAVQKLELPARTAKRARTILEEHRAEHPPLEPLIANVVDQLVVAHGRIGMWPEMKDSFDTIADGLLRTYREGRRDLRHHETPEELHDWRKRVKEHWYHIQLLRHVWPEMMKPYAEVLSTLSHALGDHHDLYVLHGKVGRLPAVTKAIEARQADLQREAEQIGARVYAEKPRAWLARMRKYWDSWPRTAR
ncbi:MAG TPA: CHAD domain-containing protein [Thermoanaerobaculia bacterium]|nr:CHAD domain-containing protein [Thermoanaerobaculia bacterium]